MAWLFRSRVTLIWALLFSATCASWALGSRHFALSRLGPGLASIAVMLVAMIKIRFVLLHFMELKHAPLAWRLIFEIWVVVLSVSLITTYLISGPPQA